MKTMLKVLLTLLMSSAFVNAFAESYTLTSTRLAVKIALQGGGAMTINDKNVGKIFSGMGAPPDAWVRQTMNLNSDNTLTGTIETDAVPFLPGGVVFNLSGKWYRPPGSKVIYIAPDGDATNADQDNAGYGNLFNFLNASFIPIQNLLSLAFSSKVISVNPINPSIKFPVGIIKLKLNKQGEVTAATSMIKVTGRAMTTYCKMDKNHMCNPTGTKDAGFSFGTTAKNTVVETP